MTKNRKLASVDDKCRICLSDDGCMIDIFSDDLKPKLSDLGDCTSIHIKFDEKFPRNICHVCLYKLDMWIEFKEHFLRSDKMLREHLAATELPDNAASVTKRKHSESQESSMMNSLDEVAAKKMKPHEPVAIPRVQDEASSKIGTKTPPDCETIVIEDSPTKTTSENVDLAERKVSPEVQAKGRLVESPTKQIAGRRGKTTERRKASTKRWVARKKALLAATGENDTETDSMSSDEAQLSPVQKARAKCNAEKVAETQRRIAKTNVTDYYGRKQALDIYTIPDTDSDTHEKSTDKTKNHSDQAEKNLESRQSMDNAIGSKNSTGQGPKKLAGTLEEIVEPKNSTDNFLPHSVRSELMIDNATFIVTSTLVLTDPHHLSPVAMPNLPKEKDNDKVITPRSDETNQERNTDIIDAVQLRRVGPKSPFTNDKKFIERCLNIEVEGTELEALQRVQAELANFVEKKLPVSLDSRSSVNVDSRKSTTQSLDQQLKLIVEKSIKKNLENSRVDKTSIENRGNNTFTGEFVKAAMRSKIFQPRVLLVRCDATEKPKKNYQPYNNRSVAKKTLISSRHPIVPSVISLGKRRSVRPAKYADYDGSAFNTSSEDSREPEKKSEPGPKSTKVKTYGPATIKHANLSMDDGSKVVETPKPEKSGFSLRDDEFRQAKTQGSEVSKQAKSSTNNSGERHICGVCGDSFSSRKEVEIHFAAHKKPIIPSKQSKQKMMRCKRCHEIVEARYVKLHVCNSPKNSHKCTSCEAAFRNEKLLVKHLETHRLEEKMNIDENTTMEDENEPDSKVPAIETPTTASLWPKKRNLATGNQMNDTYTCFVCDKIFQDEEILKDHLQKHCDDISEEEGDEPSDDKEVYQCAICGESMESEDTLESHVEKHLFDDEDDNPNLISIGSVESERTTKNNEMVHGCTQCSETFDSEMLLMLHMQAHEEEVAIAEWERRRVDNAHEEQHICVICDELYTTEAELSEHLDVHNGNAHVCLLCDKPFLTLEELQSHVNTH